MLQAIRFGLRMLARNPDVTALATIALALGIGGSTVIFSVVNVVLLRQSWFPRTLPRWRPLLPPPPTAAR